jgi:prophage antirepressor-like protein
MSRIESGVNVSEVEQFQFGERQVRVIDLDGEPWWVARDVCDVLEIERVDSSLRSLDDDERGTHTVSTPGGYQPMAIVNESGLYSLILRSRKPEAKTFKKWVTSEVLPAIRRTGGYQIAPVSVEVIVRAALAEMAHNEHVVPAAGRILSFKRWHKPDKGIKAFVQLALDLDIRLPGIEAGAKKEIAGGKENAGR